MKNYIPENLQYLVDKMKCSRDEFGTIFNLNRGNISQYINEKSQPKIETIQRICAYFEITIDDFINRSLEEKQKNYVEEPKEIYQIEKNDNSVVLHLQKVIEDKDKIISQKDSIIETLEYQVLYFRNSSDKSAG